MSRISTSICMLLFLFSFHLTIKSETRSEFMLQSEDEMLVEFYSIPSPDEILSYIHNNEIQYTPGIISDESKKNEYRTSTEKLQALGFYLADMAYTITYNQSATSLNYFEAIEELGKNLTIFPPEVEALGQRIVKNMSRMDSLNILYDEVYLTIIGNLHETGRFGEYAIISAGGFVESLYLALNSNGTKIMDDEFIKRVWEQKMIMDQLHKMIERYLSPSAKKQMISDITPLTKAFDEFIDQNTVTSSATRNDGAVLIGIVSTQETQPPPPIKKIKEEVNKLRTKWVK